jgi:D-glycero-D-manno-heptose 1,7-bisphosphate phosphatase
MNRAIFLDRDGVLCDAIVTNYKPLSAKTIEEVNIPIGTVLNCWKLRHEGFKLLCVSNQPDIARGLVDPDIIESQNEMIKHFCFLDDIMTCPHDNDDHCLCRKPKPGMIFSLARKHNIDLSQSYLIGDRWSDIEAGMNALIPNLYFIDRGYKERRPPAVFERVHFFEEAVELILNREIESNI